MKLWKKMILAFLGLVLISVVGICAYGIKIYSDANATVQGVYEELNRTTNKRETSVNIDAQEPFSVLLMGIDTGDLGRTEQGRSDTMMVVTVNPTDKKSTILSLSRDTLTEIDENGTQDKLNHAYAYGGTSMAINAVDNLLDIPIDYYVSINMKGLKDLIEAVGGVEVNNKFEFELDGITVPAGHITLDGETGLAYARMRKDDVEGDVGRQRRQREVVEKIVQKVMSLNGVTQYKKILNAVKDNVKTDLTWDDMIDIQSKYMSSLRNIETLQLTSEEAMINGVSYQVIEPTELYDIQTKLREQLGLAANTTMKAELEANSNYGSATGGTTYDTSGYSTTDQYGSYVDPNASTGYYSDSGAYEDPNSGVYVDPNAGYYTEGNAYTEPITEGNY